MVLSDQVFFFQLRTLAKVKPFLSFCDFERVMHPFVSSRLDYCNSLFVMINQYTLSQLGSRKWDHITPILSSLHWLLVCYRTDFNILMFLYNLLNGLAHLIFLMCYNLTHHQDLSGPLTKNS